MIRVLLIGCGDIALRAASMLRGRARIYGLTRRADEVPKLRAQGIVPFVADLDDFATLRRLAAAPFAVLHCAPPPSDGRDDPRTQKLLAALTRARIIPQRFVYISTSGVYGDCAGARVDETRARRAQTPRATPARGRRRPAARMGGAATACSSRCCARRASTRSRGFRSIASSRARPCSRADDDVFTNHIHADDLARAAVAAIFHGRPNRAYNVTDDAEMKMGGWFDAVADAFHLPRPPRVSWEEAEQRIAPMLLSFMSESRRLVNARMKRELRVRLAYPTPQALLAAVAPRELKKQLPLAL